MLLADGFNDAVIGIVERACSPPVVLYDADKCREIIAAELLAQGVDPEEAWIQAAEHFSFNVSGGYVGPETPAFATLDRDAVEGLDLADERGPAVEGIPHDGATGEI